MDVENIKAQFVTKWDYFGWKTNEFFVKLSLGPGYESPQKDWTQTLITKINELSAQIHMSTCTTGGGTADTIMMNEHCFKLVKEFEYFDSGEMKLGKRFDVIVNNIIGENAVFVFIKNIPKDFKYKDRTVGIVKIENY